MIVKSVSNKCAEILFSLDGHIASKGQKVLNIRQYDLKSTVNMQDMHTLLLYKKMLLNRITLCKDCYGTHSLQEISSTILRIIYK